LGSEKGGPHVHGAPESGDDTVNAGATPAEVVKTKAAIKKYIEDRLAYDKLAKDE
jgi:hypothetical protein